MKTERRVIDVEEKVPLLQGIPLSLQHLFAMFGASVLVPILFNSAAKTTVIDPALVLFMNGVGTLIYGNEFQQIRRALKKDVRSILNLTKRSVETEELVKRTRAAIEKHLADYYIFEIDRNPVACVALHTWSDLGKGELACLYVSPAHENQGIGRKLVQYVETKARELGLSELIALSTQAFTYFQSKGGFVEGTPDDLPPARREKYDQSGRKSKVLLKRLK